MRILSYNKFLLLESEVNDSNDELILPVVISEEAPDFFPCAQMVKSDSKMRIIGWDKKGNRALEFDIPAGLCSVVSDNPDSKQMVKFDSWNPWMRKQENMELISDLEEILNDDSDETLLDVSDHLSLLLDVCGIGDLIPEPAEKIMDGIYSVKLSNGMEVEIDLDEKRSMLRRIDIYSTSDNKFPIISLILHPKVKWMFKIDDADLEINDILKISDRKELISALVNASMGKTQDEEEIGTIRSYYQEQLSKLKDITGHSDFHRKDMDKKDTEIYNFKKLVAKYIGEKTADELYARAKEQIYQKNK